MRIVVLHGLFMSGIVMTPLCHRIRQAGYEVLNYSYNTTTPEPDKVFDEIDYYFGGEPGVLIGHSMGGVMARHYLESRPNNNALAVITLGSPHQGAKIVEYLQQIGGLSDMVLKESCPFLEPQHAHWPHKARLYSLAGQLGLGLFPLLAMDNKVKSDGTVAVEETKIEGMWQHKLVKQSHNSMLLSREVFDWVIDVLAEVSPLAEKQPAA
uniref:lipase family alpha/beta hydrolase n=1 Tax=Thaumasiovibrio occultus TaxID=1891184 RepID=UPI000D3AF260|nr:cob(I)alamin adenolsyltransferase [Thaumasiovibrio occultus]